MKAYTEKRISFAHSTRVALILDKLGCTREYAKRKSVFFLHIALICTNFAVKSSELGFYGFCYNNCSNGDTDCNAVLGVLLGNGNCIYLVE